jgi:FtsH-binding integral membrane protein
MAFGRSTEMVPGAVVSSSTRERVAFIRRTYLHLFAAIGAFVGLEVVLLNLSFTRRLAFRMIANPWSWIAVLLAFMIVGWVADKWAHSAESKGMQYLGLGLYVVAEAIIFMPLLFIGAYYSDPSVIPTAGLLTGVVFAGLTATVFISGKDFSFLRGMLVVGFFAALGIMLCGLLFGFKLACSSRASWSCSPAATCSTSPPTCSTTTAPTSTSPRRCRSSPRSRCSSGTSCAS